MRRGVGVSELVRAEPESGPHRWIELPDGSPAERLDGVVERANALHGAIREPLSKRALPLVEPFGRAAEGPVGVGVLLEHAEQHLIRRATSGRDHVRQTKIAQPITALSQRR